ncbi:MAG: EamA family transporter [Chloroflexi bacterium]|nr:EamA family transporter [Chloroflexota bacterium]
MPSRRPSSLTPWAAMGTIYVLWGSTYLGIAVVVESMPPFLMAAIRFVVAGLILLGWEVLRGEFRRPTRRELRDSFIVGALLLGVGNAFVGLGETSVPSGIAAVLVAMIPLWFAVLGRLYFKERLSALTGLGIAIGLAGVALLAWPTGDPGSLKLFGVVILLIAPFGWAHGSLYAAHRAVTPPRPFMASGLQMTLASIVLFGEAFVTGEFATFDPAAVTSRSIIALAYLIVFGSLVAYNAYAWLLRNAPLSLVGTYAYVNPVVALGLGALVLSEPVTPRTLVASAIILVAVAMIVTARGRASRADARDARDAAAAADSARDGSAIPGAAAMVAVRAGAVRSTSRVRAISRLRAPREGASG